MDPTALRRLLETPTQSLDAIEKTMSERSLYEFLQRSWPAFDPSRFMGNWHLGAIAEHLEAVNNGEIRRLLINIPPRCSKTNLVSIAWPAWTWAQQPDQKYPLIGPGVPFLCVAYGSDKAQEDAVTCRRLIASPWYQKHWGQHYQVAKDRDNQERYDTSAGGSRISVGILAGILGRGGNIKIIDDAMKPDDPASELVRTSCLRAYDETLSSRENDPSIAAEVIVAQRLHIEDLPGHVLSKFGSNPERGGFVHLNLPLEYDAMRHCVTSIGWEDPRGCDDNGEMLPDEDRMARDGESLWPKRFTQEVIEQRKIAEGKFSYAAKYQQLPVPRGGGIIKPEQWMLWPPQGEEFDKNGKPKFPLRFPPMDYVVAYLDTALTSKTTNDPSGMVVMGSWRSTEGRPTRTDADGRRLTDEIIDNEDRLYAAAPRIMLMMAWTEWLEFHQLVNKVIMTCRKHRVDRLIIEAKTAGHSVAQELRRLLAGEHFGITLETPRGDKDSRLHSVSHLFEAGLVYAPERKWATKVQDQCEAGSKGAHDELCLVAGTMILMADGSEKQIEKIIIGDVVETPIGGHRVISAGLTGNKKTILIRHKSGTLEGTPNHPVMTNNGLWTDIVDISVGSNILMFNQLKDCSSWYSNQPDSSESNPSSSMGIATTDILTAREAHTGIISPEQTDSCIGISGNFTMGRFPRSISFIIKTAIRSIMTSQIWNVFQCRNTLSNTKKPEASTGSANPCIFVRRQPKPQHGMGLPKGWLGTNNTDTKILTSKCQGHVFTAATNLLDIPQEKNSAEQAVETKPLTSSEVVGVLSVNILKPVYNLTVDAAHCFFANNILVHNCDSVSGGLRHLRSLGEVQTQGEFEDEVRQEFSHSGDDVLYDV